MKWVGIDVGLENFAFVAVELGSEYNLSSVTDCNIIDITKYSVCTCTDLPHSKHISDLMKHLFVDIGHILDSADLILVEKQPPQGFVVIEQILFGTYRSKAVLVHPRSMHKYWGIGMLDRDGRKSRTVRIAKPYLRSMPAWKRSERRHDMADAMCIILYYASQKRVWYVPDTTKRRLQEFLYDQT